MTALDFHPAQIEAQALAAVLLDAADVIDQRGLAKGAYSDPSGAVCAVGAIHVASGRAPDECHTDCACGLCETYFQASGVADVLADWSDQAGRTAADVSHALRTAAGHALGVGETKVREWVDRGLLAHRAARHVHPHPPRRPHHVRRVELGEAAVRRARRLTAPTGRPVIVHLPKGGSTLPHDSRDWEHDPLDGGPNTSRKER